MNNHEIARQALESGTDWGQVALVAALVVGALIGLRLLAHCALALAAIARNLEAIHREIALARRDRR